MRANYFSEIEPYAMVISISDRSAQEPRLYTRIEARLRERIRLRARV